MAYWLLKTEPSEYSFDDLVKEKKAVWSGVTNPTALKNIRSMKPGDLVFVYHTGDERSVIGVAKVDSAPYPDPEAENPKIVVVDIKPERRLARSVTLDTIKKDPAFEGWDLLRIGRLSVVPTPPAMWKRIEKLAGD